MKIWDYQTKTCIQTLSGHEDNVSVVRFHPRLPYILSGGEDNRVLVHHSGTYKKERVLLQPALDRCWSIGLSDHSNQVVLGYDEGYCVYRMGRENAVVSMDQQGRVVWAKRQEMWLAVCEGSVSEREGSDAKSDKVKSDARSDKAKSDKAKNDKTKNDTPLKGEELTVQTKEISLNQPSPFP